MAEKQEITPVVGVQEEDDSETASESSLNWTAEKATKVESPPATLETEEASVGGVVNAQKENDGGKEIKSSLWPPKGERSVPQPCYHNFEDPLKGFQVVRRPVYCQHCGEKTEDEVVYCRESGCSTKGSVEFIKWHEKWHYHISSDDASDNE